MSTYRGCGLSIPCARYNQAYRSTWQYVWRDIFTWRLRWNEFWNSHVRLKKSNGWCQAECDDGGNGMLKSRGVEALTIFRIISFCSVYTMPLFASTFCSVGDGHRWLFKRTRARRWNMRFPNTSLVTSPTSTACVPPSRHGHSSLAPPIEDHAASEPQLLIKWNKMYVNPTAMERSSYITDGPKTPLGNWRQTQWTGQLSSLDASTAEFCLTFSQLNVCKKRKKNGSRSTVAVCFAVTVRSPTTV